MLTKIKQSILDKILNFDPQDPGTDLLTAICEPSFMSVRNLPKIPWEAYFAPVPKPIGYVHDDNAPLRQADVLIVTWTVVEALALSDVLTPGYKSKTDWYQYKHNWDSLFKPMLDTPRSSY